MAQGKAKAASGAGQIKDEGKQAVQDAVQHPWVETMMRLGYAVRGLIYGLVGLLAIGVAFGGRGQITDQQGAIAALGAQPLGKVLLVLVAAGLAGYALWGVVRFLLDPLHKGTDAKGWIARIGFFISGLSYAALEIPTIRLLMNLPGGARNGAQTASTQQTAASVMSRPWGPWLIGAIGLGFVGAGVSQISQGWESKFDMRFDSYALDARQRRLATRLGRVGYVARGIVFAMVGILLFQAALYHNIDKVGGIDKALLELSRQPYGTVLLGLAAAGLIAFGAYSILGAAWFRFKKA